MQELIDMNPFSAASNPSAAEQPRSSLIHEIGGIPSVVADLTQSEKFSQRVVSLGPHSYIE